MIKDLIARLRTRLREPSPILVRELRALFRLPLFVRFLSLATGGIALVVLGIASVALTERTAPSELGRILFDSFFVLVLFVTSVVTPLHAATSITSEREAQTYETLILSGMDPARIAVGKFLSTLSAIGLVVVAISPVVGLSFLFGGVSPFEVLLGFFYVAALVTPGAAFGVAVSSRFQSTRTAILITLVATFGALPFFTVPLMVFTVAFSLTGSMGSSAFDVLRWVSDNLTDINVLAGAILLPFALSGLATWFLVSSAIARLRPAAEDRTTPFKRWTVALVLTDLLIVFGVAANDTGHADSPMFAAAFSMMTSAVIVNLFMDDAPLPPRTGQGLVRATFFGPGLLGSARFAFAALLVVNVLNLVVLLLGLHVAGTDTSGMANDIRFVALAGGVDVGLGMFVLLLGSCLRTAIDNGNLVRGLTVVICGILTVMPLLLAMIVAPERADGFRPERSAIMTATPSGPLITLAAAAGQSGSARREGPVIMSAILYLALAGGLALVLRARVNALAGAVEEGRRRLAQAIEARREARAGAT